MSGIDKSRAMDLLARLWRWIDQEQAALPFTKDPAILERLYVILVSLEPEDERSISAPQRLKRAVLERLLAFPSTAQAFFTRLADRPDGRFPSLREYHLIMAERSLQGDPALAPLSRDAAARWVAGIEAEEPSNTHDTEQPLTAAVAIASLAAELLTDGRLMTRTTLCNRHEAAYDLLPGWAMAGLISEWQEEFLMVTPKGLALAPDHLTEKLTKWVDGAQPALADLDRERQNQEWSMAELAERCHLSLIEMRLSILYRSRFLYGVQGTSFDQFGLPTATHLRFEIRLPRTSLMEKIVAARVDLERAKAPILPTHHPEVATITVPPSIHEVSLRERLTNGDNPSYPPGRAASLPPAIDYGTPEVCKEVLRNGVDVLLLTATQVERDAMLRRLTKIPGCSAVLQLPIDQQTYFFGQMGTSRVAVVMSRMGAVGRDSALQTLNDAITDCLPRCVVAVGIAFGGYTKKLSMADVLISARIIPYDPVRKQPGGDQPRASQPDAGATLLNRFRNVVDWEFRRPDGHLCKKLDGALLTGEALVDDLDFKTYLFEMHSDAIGGEMEASGVYAAASKHNREWIIVKAVCDWADGTKGDGHQEVAAEAAASLVAHTLGRENVIANLEPLPPPRRQRTPRASKPPPPTASAVVSVIDERGAVMPGPDTTLEFTTWLQQHCGTATRMLAEDFRQGPQYYFYDNGSSAYCDDFYALIDMWRTWCSALITGLKRRLKHADHIVEDAKTRFADSRLLRITIQGWREPAQRHTFDLRDRALFTFGDGYHELRQWYGIGREDPSWNGITQGLRYDVDAFARMLLNQVDELEFALPTGGSGTGR